MTQTAMTETAMTQTAMTQTAATQAARSGTARSRLLDELTLTVVVDNETDTLSSVDVGVPQLPEVASHLARRPAQRQHAGHDCVTVFDHLCVACHGLSVLATGRIGDETRTMLFDVGPYGDVWVDNAERLGVDLASIDDRVPVALALGPQRRAPGGDRGDRCQSSGEWRRRSRRRWTCTPTAPTSGGSNRPAARS